MSNTRTAGPTQESPLRLWPGVVIVVLQWLARFVLPVVIPEYTPYGAMGAMFCGVALLVWWVFLSRAPWMERLGVIVLMALALFVTPNLVHESIATGAMGMLFYLYAIPGLSLALVAWAVASQRLPDGLRWATMVATILIAGGGWALVKTGGFSSGIDSDFTWRWAKTAEERLLAQDSETPTRSASISTAAAAEAGDSNTDWSGFRGPQRDGILRGVRIGTDWSASPPAELWRRPIGPGWSSFAASGGLFYTQEQRGEDEVVSCYSVATGEPVWRHGDAARFWESNAGAGPRGTPTLSGGRVYTLGATGIVNALDATDGSVVWSRNAASDTNSKIPTWGISGSPLVLEDKVVVAASGALVAYDRDTGELRWTGPAGRTSYSSPHLLTIDGVEQILQLNGDGLNGVATDGTTLWEHPWSGYPIVQPALTADGDILISVSDSSGIRRLDITQGASGWAAEERWTSIRLKPYFSDFVVHEGHAFGFDGSILAAIDLEDGERKWKGGRYGQGQLFLLAEQDLLMVLSEKGEIALVNATPDKFTEAARAPAIKGKTWNHPILTDDVLLVRNAEEMVAFRLSLTS